MKPTHLFFSGNTISELSQKNELSLFNWYLEREVSLSPLRSHFMLVAIPIRTVVLISSLSLLWGSGSPLAPLFKNNDELVYLVHNSTLSSAAEGKNFPSFFQVCILYSCRYFSIVLAIIVIVKGILSRMSYMIESETGQVRDLFSLSVFKSFVFLNFQI